MLHRHRMRHFFTSQSSHRDADKRHYRGGLQYAWQEYRLEPVLRLTVVPGVLEEGAGEKGQKEIGEPLELEVLHGLQKQDELRKNRVSLYVQRQSCSISVSKRLAGGMSFQGAGEGSKAVRGVWAGQKHSGRVSGY